MLLNHHLIFRIFPRPFTLFSQEYTMSFIPTPRDVQASSFNNGNDQYIIVNGRRIFCGNGVSGRDITSAAGNPSKRRVVKIASGHVQKIDPFHHYSPEELRDKNGRPVKIKTMPERTKGGLLDFFGNASPASREPNPAPRPSAPQTPFSGRRSEFSRRLILDQINDVARNVFKAPVQFDNGGDWVVFPSFRLPGNWSVPTTPLMILFPTDYPVLPPIGFYLPDTLPSPNGHKYAQAYHSASAAPLMRGWHWYCCYVQDGAWQPAPMNARNGWRDGDNLYTYLTLVSEALASSD